MRHVFADGTAVDLPNARRAGVADALDAALGEGSGARWSAFMNRAREAWDRTRRPLLEEPLWPNWRILADREPYPAVVRRRLLRKDLSATTLAEVAALELGGDPRLVALLEQYALASGLDPRTAPASAAVLPYMEQTFGTWAVRGGMRALAGPCTSAACQRKVAFEFDAPVARIVEKDGRAAGVELADGRVVEADFVVAGVAPGVLDELLPGRALRAEDSVAPQSALPSRLTVFLALRGARPADAAHRTVVHAADREAELASLFGGGTAVAERPTVTVLRPDDASVVPDADHEAVTLVVTVARGARGDGRGRGAGHGRSRAGGPRPARPSAVARGPHPGGCRRRDGRGRRLGARTGPGRGLRPAPAPVEQHAVPGLFAVGGWSHPGGGLPHAGMSGALVGRADRGGPGLPRLAVTDGAPPGSVAVLLLVVVAGAAVVTALAVLLVRVGLLRRAVRRRTAGAGRRRALLGHPDPAGRGLHAVAAPPAYGSPYCCCRVPYASSYWGCAG